MASGNLVMHSPASQGLQIDSTFESIDSQRVCPLFPCAFDYRERRFKKLLRTLTHTMKSMFLPHIRGASLDKRVELLETAFAEKSPLLHQSMPADREWKLGGIVLNDVCGFYLLQLFLSLVTVDEESGLTSSLQAASSSSFSEDNYDMQEQPRLHPSYELYENFRIVLKKFPRAAQFVDQDGLSLLHHLTLFYTSNVDRRYRYDALDEENTTLFRVIQILIRLCYVSAPSMAILFAKTDRGFATPVHILLTSGNNNDVDYELLHQMIVDNPTAASQEFLNGRMLLHLLLASIPCFEKELENYLTLLKATISIYPEAAFKTVYEEIRLLRVDNPQEGVDRGNTQTFTMHVRKMHWSPVQKAKEVKNTKVQQVFSKLVDAISWARIKSQIRK